MVYVGSKQRIRKYITPHLIKNRFSYQHIVEPFCGGCNITSEIEGLRIANDIDPYLIALWKALVYGGWQPPEYITKNEYIQVRDAKGNYQEHFVAWVGFICSYQGKWFGGWSGKHKSGRNHQTERRNNILKQVPKLQGVKFSNQQYYDLYIPENSIIYCDPPYANSTGYKSGSFDHDLFWQWCRNKAALGHQVFVSEYNAPEDFTCIWSKEKKSTLDRTRKLTVEKLFTI